MTIELLQDSVINPAISMFADTDFSDLFSSPGWDTMKNYIWKIISTPFIRFDWWDVVGFIGQLLFFSRFIVQWIASEKKKRNVLPVSFWYLSIAGALISLFYFIHLGRLPLIAAGMASMVIYSRNLQIWFRRRASRQGLVFASDTVSTETEYESADSSEDEGADPSA